MRQFELIYIHSLELIQLSQSNISDTEQAKIKQNLVSG